MSESSDIHVEFEFDIERKQAAMRFTLNDILATLYKLEDGAFSTGARPQVVEIPSSEFFKTLKKEKKWIEFIDKNFLLYPSQKTPYSFEIEKNDDEIKTKLTIGSNLVAEDIWTKNTDIITFGARPAIDITWDDFKNLFDYWVRLSEEIASFGSHVPLSSG